MIDARVVGAQQLRAVAAHIKAAGERGLGREFGKALERAVDPVKKAITESAAQTMPSGYAPTLTRSLKHRRSTRTDAHRATVQLATYADGRRERRDLPSLEAGQLRHPVFGRRQWVTQRIRPGFHQRATDKTGDEAEKQILAAVDDFTQRLAEG